MLALTIFCLVILTRRVSLSSPLNSPNSHSAFLRARWESGPLLTPVTNFPDPSLVLVRSTWYTFATRTKGSNVHIQIASSRNFLNWTLVLNDNGSQRDALPILPPWVDGESCNTWAPDVVQLDDGSFVMYYSASTEGYPSRHCIGVATSDNILGPYKPQPNPLICPITLGGAIDASGFNDGGNRYIVYKIDGNTVGHGGPCCNTVPPIAPTPLVLQPVQPDGISPAGPPKILLNNHGVSDQGTIEAPVIAKFGSTYVLLFSSGCFTTEQYTVDYAIASSVTGPYTRAARPLFRTGDDGLVGPGGMSVWQEGGYMVFHAWVTGGVRTLFGAQVELVNGVVSQRGGNDDEMSTFGVVARTVEQLVRKVRWKW